MQLVFCNILLWESLDPSDKPQTWNDMKLLMRETFVNPPPVLTSYDEVHHLEEDLLLFLLLCLTFCRTMYKRARMA